MGQSKRFHGKWYSVFVSPTQNVHYFSLTLPELDEGKVNEGKMTLLAKRAPTDGRTIEVDYRVHIEICGPFIALMAKDVKSPSDGVNVMLLKLLELDGDDHVLDGMITWSSLSSGNIKTNSITWTRNRSAAHRDAA